MDNQFNSHSDDAQVVSNNSIELKFKESDNNVRPAAPVQPNYSYQYNYAQNSSNGNFQTNAKVVSENSFGNQNQQKYNNSSNYNNHNNKKKKSGWIAALIAGIVVVTLTCGIFAGYGVSKVIFNHSIKNNNQNNNSNNVIQNENKHETDRTDDFFNYAIEDKNTQALSIPEIAAKNCPSVVEITTEIATYGGWFGNSVQSGAGSGVILTEDGYIVTNHHVIEGASKITVTVDDEHKYEAKIIGSDENADIALIKVDASGLSPVSVGNSDNMVVGEKAIVIGNPLGTLGDTVTDGIISALDREIKIDNHTNTLFQTNAAINPGNSGGGVFNAAGNLIGIVDAKSAGADIEGLGFAIPVNVMTKVVKEIMEYGYVKGYVDTGIEFVDINDYFSAMQYRVNQFGVYVLKVNSDLALNAGFQSGDLVTTVAGINVSTSSDIAKVLKEFKVGDKVEFEVLRPGNQTVKLTLELGEYVPSTLSNSNFK